MLWLLAMTGCGHWGAGEHGVQAPEAGPGFARPPHVVFLVLDTLRADHLGFHGYTRDTSSELDRMAAEGLWFQNAWSSSPWTRPSVATMLTGVSPREHGIREERRHMLPPEIPVLAEQLRAAGYATFGKTANPNLNARYGFDRGFDTYRDSRVVFDWMREDGAEGRSATNNPLAPSEEIVAAALQFARQERERPVFLFLDFMEVHEHPRGEEMWLTRSEHRGRHDHPYDDAITQLSGDVDRLVSGLLALPGWEETLVVVTSDHGEGLTDHPSVPGAALHGPALYESTLRVPLLLWSPRGQVGRGAVPTLTSLEDLSPTLLAITGAGSAGSRSILPGAEREARTFVYVETAFRGADKLGITDGSWIYVESREGTGAAPELQRVGAAQDGPATSRHAAEPEVLARMDALLEAWEASHPRREPALAEGSLSKRVRLQLEAIGYMHP